MLIDSKIFPLPNLQMSYRSIAEIKAEPMLFQCDLNRASKLGGPITSEFLSLLPREWRESSLRIDSRVHMLMPGWFPCIPGWHHDDVPRTRLDSQPDYENVRRAQHLMVIVSSVPDLCPTQFALGAAELEVPEVGKTIYAEWHKDVELLIRNKVLHTQSVVDRQLTIFDDRAWHRGTAATTDGWRWFVRVTRHLTQDGSPLKLSAANELRHQTQVYMPAVNAGW